jgi:hypothetical protein
MRKTLNASTLDQGTRPALVGFWAEWRAPFPAVVPVLGRVAGERDLRLAELIAFYTENVDLYVVGVLQRPR